MHHLDSGNSGYIKANDTALQAISTPDPTASAHTTILVHEPDFQMPEEADQKPLQLERFSFCLPH